MKYGFIFECGREGADVKVFRHLMGRIDAAIEFEPVTMDDKGKLLEESAEQAELLLKMGCDRVFVVWDLHPKHPGCGCIAAERDFLLQKYASHGLPIAKIEFIGLVYELESWLLADGRALERVLFPPTHKDTIKGEKAPDQIKLPKSKLISLFTMHKGSRYRYVDTDHALRIISNVDHLKNLKKSKSFSRFYLKVTGTTL